MLCLYHLVCLVRVWLVFVRDRVAVFQVPCLRMGVNGCIAGTVVRLAGDLLLPSLSLFCFVSPRPCLSPSSSKRKDKYLSRGTGIYSLAYCTQRHTPRTAECFLFCFERNGRLGAFSADLGRRLEGVLFSRRSGDVHTFSRLTSSPHEARRKQLKTPTGIPHDNVGGPVVQHIRVIVIIF